jgi:hypothetical protein
MKVERFLNTYTFLPEPNIFHIATIICVELC